MGKVEILDPKTWVKFKPSLCPGCFAGCCTLPVLVSPEDLYHMGYVKYEEVEGPMEGVARRLYKKGIIQSYQPRRKLFILKQKKNNDCIFLTRKRLCKIYDKRPSICRKFPDGGPRPKYCPSQRFKS